MLFLCAFVLLLVFVVFFDGVCSLFWFVLLCFSTLLVFVVFFDGMLVPCFGFVLFVF